MDVISPLPEARRDLLYRRRRSMGSEAQVSLRACRPSLGFRNQLSPWGRPRTDTDGFRWDGLKAFLSLPRQPLYCGPGKGTKAFVRSYKNLHFYWIIGAGHFVSSCCAISVTSTAPRICFPSHVSWVFKSGCPE